MKKIVLISSGQPSINPRLVKEADLLSNSGYEVFVIYSFWIKWAYDSDFVLFKRVSWKPILVGGTPFNNKILFFYTRIRHKLFSIIAKWNVFGFQVAEISKGRAFVEMLQKAKSIKADIYIAHNLAALPIAVKAAKYHKAKCGFDAEDFHRQEVTDDCNSFEYKSAKYLEDKYLPQIDYFTAASPLIAAEYKKLYPNLNPIIINNVFLNKFTILNSQFSIQNSPLKLFWFSQTIGKGRGIETVIEAISKLQNSQIELHLLGNSTDDIRNYFSGLFPKVKITFYQPLAPDDIFEFASQFDIGLALEQNIPYNRDICLTNKIFTYLTSGLVVIASETAAQKHFMEENSSIGKSFALGGVEKLAKIINDFYHNKDYLNTCKCESLKLAQEKYNWELESKKLIEIINKTL